MQVKVQCNVKSLSFSEISRTLRLSEIGNFSEAEYAKSSTLRSAIRTNWVTVLKKSFPTIQKKSASSIKSQPIEEQSPRKKSKRSKE